MNQPCRDIDIIHTTTIDERRLMWYVRTRDVLTGVFLWEGDCRHFQTRREAREYMLERRHANRGLVVVEAK